MNIYNILYYIIKYMTLKKAKQIIKDLHDTYSNINTVKTKIVNLLSELKKKEQDTGLNKTEKKIQDLYRKEVYKLQIEVNDRPKPEFDKNNQLEKLREEWNQHVDNRDKLITGLYIWLEPLRSDYADSTYKEGFITLKLIKTNKDIEKKIKVPNQLIELCNNFYDSLPKINNTFVKTLSRASDKIFKRNLTINDFRKIWTEYGLRKLSVSEQKKLAKNMNHSFATHMNNYTPKMEPVYKEDIDIDKELEKITQLAERL